MTHEKVVKVVRAITLERLHLAYLKWITHIPKGVSIVQYAPVWGDCGRYPIAVTLVNSTVDNINRLISLVTDAENSEKLVRHA